MERDIFKNYCYVTSCACTITEFSIINDHYFQRFTSFSIIIISQVYKALNTTIMTLSFVTVIFIFLWIFLKLALIVFS